MAFVTAHVDGALDPGSELSRAFESTHGQGCPEAPHFAHMSGCVCALTRVKEDPMKC